MPEQRSDREQKTTDTREQSQAPAKRESTQQSAQLRRRSAIDPTSPLELVRRVTEQMFGPSLRGLTRSVEEWVPSIEVSERDGKLVVTADLPGMSNNDVRAEVRDHNLIIEGERKQEKKEDREGYFLTERTYGKFYRVIPLPDDVNPDTAKASFRNGVLELIMDLPRDRQSQGKTIPIEEKSETSS